MALSNWAYGQCLTPQAVMFDSPVIHHNAGHMKIQNLFINELRRKKNAQILLITQFSVADIFL